MHLTSPDFSDGGSIPVQFTCDGGDLMPTLQFSDAPAATQSLALIVDDPDAPGGDFVHWLVWNLPPTVPLFGGGSLPLGAVTGRNDFGHSGYGGPCPPTGTHRYQFKLYALDLPLSLDSASTKARLEQVMAGHILAQSVLRGHYRRP